MGRIYTKLAGRARYLSTSAILARPMAPPVRLVPATFSGILALLFPLALSGLPGCQPSPAPPHRLLLITVDTLRADRLGCYGHQEPLTPHLDRVASEGALLEQVIVPVPRTSQSIATLLTGLNPAHHGVRGLFWRLPEDRGTTLAQALSARGFAAAALTSNLVLRSGQGFERGFQLYDDPPSRWDRDAGQAIVEDALDWIGRQGDRPWFLWTHILDPHWSYEPSPPHDRLAGGLTEEDRRLFREVDTGEVRKGQIVFGGLLDAAREEKLRRLYDGEVEATDAAIGRLLDGLRERKLLDGTLLLVTADHGESLGEHGYRFAHGETLYDDTLRVPTLVRFPATIPAGRRLRRLVPSYDLMPTLLDLLGVPMPAGLDGVSRAAELRGGPEGNEGREIYVETDRQFLLSGNPSRFLPGYAGSWRGLRDERYKVIRIPRPGGDVREVFDLGSDPVELRDLSASLPPAAAALASHLPGWEARASMEATDDQASPAGTAPDAEEIERLRSLGYVESGGAR